MLKKGGISYTKYCIEVTDVLPSELYFDYEFKNDYTGDLNEIQYYGIIKNKN